jgi:uncharacterized protein (DUF885 family)
MKKSLATLSLVILSACGGGGADPVTQPEASPTDQTGSEKFAQDIQSLALPDFYAVSFGELIKRTPETVVTSTLDDIYPLDAARLNDWSDEYQDETWAMYQLALDKLNTYDRSGFDADGELEYDIYEWWLQDAVAELPFKNYSFAASYGAFGVPRNTQRFFEELHPLETAQDVENFLERLSAIDTKFAQLEAHLLRQRNAGIIEPALTMQVAINGLSAFAQTRASQNPIYLSFSRKINHLSSLGDARLADWRNTALLSPLAQGFPRDRVVSTVVDLAGKI